MSDRWVEAAARTAGPISTVGAAFMSSAELRHAASGVDVEFVPFYLAGRAGVLGDDATAEQAVSALVFFEPGLVTTAWSATAALPRHELVDRYADAAARFAETRRDDELDWAELARLATQVFAADGGGSGLLAAGWSARTPEQGRRAVASHRLNVLREMRMGLHATALAEHSVPVAEAVRFRSPALVKLFGWTPGSVPDEVVARWSAAEVATNVAVAERLRVLDGGQLERFEHLVDAAHRCWLAEPVTPTAREAGPVRDRR